MFNVHKQEISWGGRPLTLETGRIARQADGAVLVTYGGTSVLATAVADREPKPGLGFMPLSVHYQEKTYSVGRIPGGYFKREGRPTEKDTLTSRLIDRPLRPLFPEGFSCETQVIATVVAYDGENNADIVGLVASSAALALSGIPFAGPVGAARVGLIDGQYVLNPTTEQMDATQLDLVVAGTQDAVMMVESQAQELSEKQMLDAVMFGHNAAKEVIQAIQALAADAAKPAREFTAPDYTEHFNAIMASHGAALGEAYANTDKSQRSDAVRQVKEAVRAALVTDADDVALYNSVNSAFKAAEKHVVRRSIVDTRRRIDGRDGATVRPIVTEASVLPRTHGSVLFTRGETQALVVTTLGTGDDEQYVDSLNGTYKEKFLLHYNFPPYSVGEVGRMVGAGRREIGHGKLAWRALKAVLPSHEEFPYTLRLVSEITESNGSSSMATVCGGSMSMMDAGVPLKSPVAGIAMGLILESDDYVVLSDILGDEDHLGDMDFKVAGTATGVTALQMDIKIAGINEEIMAKALEQALQGRMHILGEMAKTLSAPREEVSEYAPRTVTMKIATNKIREVIGSGGKVIRELCDSTGCKIDIKDDGTVRISSSSGASIEEAKRRISDIAVDPEVGAIYRGRVVKVVDFGAFVNFSGQRDGLVHISQLADYRVQQVTDVVKEGDMVMVKLLEIDDRGRARLSMRAVEAEGV